jgi:hypothetical protein
MLLLGMLICQLEVTLISVKIFWEEKGGGKGEQVPDLLMMNVISR